MDHAPEDRDGYCPRPEYADKVSSHPKTTLAQTRPHLTLACGRQIQQLHMSSLIRTKLTPPRPHQHTLHRPRLTQRLLDAQNYRLTILQAGTGYGKSTALADLTTTSPYTWIWYHLDAEDIDPLRFLLHLISGFKNRLSYLSETPIALLEEWERNRNNPTWTAVIDSLVNELAAAENDPMFLILDDTHHLQEAGQVLLILNRFIGRAPTNLHLILSSRYPLQLPNLVTWRIKGELLEIRQHELTFTTAEVETLFREQYGFPLTSEQALTLTEKVEGWPITLHLVWQRLQSGSTLTQALGRLSRSAGDLLIYLAQETLAQQQADVQEFLRLTAVLRQMTAPACDYLRQARNSSQMLRYLLENGLFVVDLGEGYVRYHHLFRDLLLGQLTPAEARSVHQKAAAYYQEQDEGEEAIYHLLAAGALAEAGGASDFAEAATLLSQLGRKMVRLGRLDTLLAWIGSLPPEVLENHPPLLVYLGDIARLHSRFDEALGWYQQAEQRGRALGDTPGIGQALRGQARVYLDTVNPIQAETLLQEALRVSEGLEDRESRARLLELLAENMLNQGRMEQARQYQEQAHMLRQAVSDESELSVRLLLRTGRLDEARRLLEEQIRIEQENPVLRPRGHRETLLLLALVLTFQGEGEAASLYAIQGTERGQALQSQFITAVGYMRQGHTWLLQKDAQGCEEARRCFQQALDLSDTLAVPRLKIEANWGLCQAHGFKGDLETALAAARQGIHLARAYGDEWVEACLHLTMGATYVLAGRYTEATQWLEQAGNAFRECGDTFGQANGSLWQCLVWYHSHDTARLERDVAGLLHLAQKHGYDYLFRQHTLLGPPDPRALVPILLFARQAEIHPVYVRQLLAQMGLERTQSHPGYQLRVQLLGALHVWRGKVEIEAGDWRRLKAQQLFLFLLTHRHILWEREQICDALWPELSPEQAQRDFKIAYSTLLNVLEPQRNRNAPSAYVIRDGSRYGWCTTADFWLDVAAFEDSVCRGDEAFHQSASEAIFFYHQAMQVYRGEYLQEFPFEEWCTEERERMSALFLQMAERLATILLQQQAWKEAARVAQVILTYDDCWENAYRILMRAYAEQGQHGQAVRTYWRCVERLSTVLGVVPSPMTRQLFEALS